MWGKELRVEARNFFFFFFFNETQHFMLKSLQSLRSTSRITIRSLATIISSSKRMLEQPTPERIEELKQSFSIIQNEVNQASIDRVEGNQVSLSFSPIYTHTQLMILLDYR